ncbi:hypothetical protein AGABI1DRAFT_122219 [Agaricus bisporus var. burnettii JB137-S8]|uniref:Peptidase M48 domain-containing protein n=1 Tax=Agaricus bisporus var. burnettii (strain JB137-S8 / ATCC MYA-4627 / FGSC 10392) TaxID=597362 RepID=K5X2R3_AGABU|nr:uncharacterized protein AGABI1DRAFT_122219 [Agaricus bisporus var. burnettii JB137-S8]EKM77197.1 hypothetical protein AGABI1DRAFT_122219 [Agaricus bisporus var. burnettii JB137-S8]
MFRPLLTASRLTCRIPKRELWTTIPKRNRYVRFSDGNAGRPSPNNQPGWRKFSPPVTYGAVIFAGIGVFYVTHLEQVPQTGRWRFMIFSSRSEAQIGESVRQETKNEWGNKILPPNHPLSLHVRKVTSRILKSSDLGHIIGEAPTPPPISPFGFADEVWKPSDDYGAAASYTYSPQKEWDVVVVNDKRVVNAMATPGLILVFTGILPVCRDEQGLAAVLSHEIGHVVARHSAERLSSGAFFMAISFFLQITGLDVIGFTPFINHFLLELPNSRTQEYEADLIGVRLMSRACYDPAEMVQMFKRLEAATGSNRVDFLATHPSTGQRIKQLEETLPDAYSILASNPECAALRDKLEQFGNRMTPIRINDFGEIEHV